MRRRAPAAEHGLDHVCITEVADATKQQLECIEILVE
jgi:hypothetical protein